uniref:Coiled-coil alpha-helical rod protein 1 n=1 Tax=Gasterosteus aculeatus aculeatus TaxID=481459 RepID=A0AAQ4RTP9_GASAC|nr:coiled-coil alpha-helical rod protein 1 [Gasterosteus aculeatus aculeatus]
MERRNFGKERLIVPTDFTSPAVSRNIQEDLVPPSHFTSSLQSAGAHGGVQMAVTAPPDPWINPGMTSLQPGDPSPNNQWLAIRQARQENLDLRRENQRILMLQGGVSGRNPVDHQSDLRPRCAEGGAQRSRWESEWRLEADKYKAEAERLKGQVEALKETAARHREEMRDRDGSLNRTSHELEAMREELCRAKTEISQIRGELSHGSAQKEEIGSQLARLKKESGEQITELRQDLMCSKAEAQELTLKAEMWRLQAAADGKQQILALSGQLEEIQKRHKVELLQLNNSHCAELAAARSSNRELQDRLESMTSGVLQLKSTLMEVSAERDGLKEHLSQMGQAFETQSATLNSLRNYIGQLAPEKEEKEQLNEAVKKLRKEKAALQMTTELLTVRFNSVSEILTLQEEKIGKKTSTDPLGKNESEGLQVLRLWRDKVFKLCVQLRSKDIELRGEKDEVLSKVKLLEQELQQEQHRANVLQHSLDDRIAELDLERLEKETLKRDFALEQQENSQLKSQSEREEAELKVLTEAVRRFSFAIEGKVAEMDTTQARLNTLTQRLTFAKRQVETIQGLTMRKVALQKAKQASKPTEQTDDRITDLQAELRGVCEERDKLTQELKRTPELIEKALADLKEQHESKLRWQQQQLEQSRAEVRQALAGGAEAERSLQQIQAQLEESKVNLEELRSELLSQQEHSERALQQRVSELEDCCAEKLSEMEVQVKTAKREHTKAVMTLRQFERDAARKEDRMRGTQQQKKRDIPIKQQPLLAPVAAERRLTSERARTHTAAREHRKNPSERSHCVLPADGRLLSVLEELHSLSAAVVNSSEDSAEEDEGPNDNVGPSTGRTADT